MANEQLRDMEQGEPEPAETLAVACPSSLDTEDSLYAQARAFLRASKAPSTLRAYRADWRHFVAWCAERRASPLPAGPETVALYLAAWPQPTAPPRLPAPHRDRQGPCRSRAPQLGHHKHLLVAETLQGIRRTRGTAQPGKTPLLTADLLQVLAHLPSTLAGLQDRALLLVGYSGGLRRSELAALTVDDLAWVEEGAVLTLRRSKTDQEGQGRKVAIPKGAHAATCPVTALRAWLEAAEITTGALFREVDRHARVGKPGLHADSVGVIVKRAVKRAGFEAKGFAGHSLRAGFATQAARNGASAFDIMRQTGHRSLATVSRYVRDAPATKLGL